MRAATGYPAAATTPPAAPDGETFVAHIHEPRATVAMPPPDPAVWRMARVNEILGLRIAGVLYATEALDLIHRVNSMNPNGSRSDGNVIRSDVGHASDHG